MDQDLGLCSSVATQETSAVLEFVLSHPCRVKTLGSVAYESPRVLLGDVAAFESSCFWSNFNKLIGSSGWTEMGFFLWFVSSLS